MSKKSITHRSLGLHFQACKSIANTNIIHVDLSGCSYWSLNNTEKNRKGLAKWLRKVAQKVENWKP